jgi:hypothetical protein
VLSFEQIYRRCKQESEWTRLFEEVFRESQFGTSTLWKRISNGYRNLDFNKIIEFELNRLKKLGSKNEYMSIFNKDKDGNMNMVLTWEGTESGIPTDCSGGFDTSNFENNGEIWIFHSHTNATSFSTKDYLTFCNNNLIKGLYLIDKNGTKYSIQGNKPKPEELDEIIKNVEEELIQQGF